MFNENEYYKQDFYFVFRVYIQVSIMLLKLDILTNDCVLSIVRGKKRG